MNYKNSVTFVGGPLDLTRQEFHGPVPRYWRVATAPKLGPVFEKPERPNMIPSSVSFDYEIVPMHGGRGQTVYLAFPLELSP